MLYLIIPNIQFATLVWRERVTAKPPQSATKSLSLLDVCDPVIEALYEERKKDMENAVAAAGLDVLTDGGQAGRKEGRNSLSVTTAR
eukprot:1966933-Pyramimonas_sp.AAC.1